MAKAIVTKTEQLLKALLRNHKLTSREITERFNIANPPACIWDLRHKSGYNIQLVEVRNRKTGETARKYCMA